MATATSSRRWVSPWWSCCGPSGETERLLADKSYLESVYRAGAEKAAYVANRTLNKVYKKVGFLPR